MDNDTELLIGGRHSISCWVRYIQLGANILGKCINPLVFPTYMS